jgi:hypothetical protein
VDADLGRMVDRGRGVRVYHGLGGWLLVVLDIVWLGVGV